MADSFLRKLHSIGLDVVHYDYYDRYADIDSLDLDLDEKRIQHVIWEMVCNFERTNRKKPTKLQMSPDTHILLMSNPGAAVHFTPGYGGQYGTKIYGLDIEVMHHVKNFISVR